MSELLFGNILGSCNEEFTLFHLDISYRHLNYCTPQKKIDEKLVRMGFTTT